MASNNLLYVHVAAKSESKAMGIFKMSDQAIRNLQYGKKVHVRILKTNGTTYQLNGQITLRALTAFSPAVSRALRLHNQSNRGPITDVVLPSHGKGAYYKMLGWINACINEGKVVHPKPAKRYAREQYLQLKALADDLSMGYLANAMDGRMAAMRKAPSV